MDIKEQFLLSPISEEQKQLVSHFDEDWILHPEKLPPILKNSFEDRPQEFKNQQQELTTKGVKKSKRAVDEIKNINRGHWSYEQNKKYHWFLEIYYKHFVNRHMRRTDKIFKTMQLFIGTRQAEQCRSHHQKMEKKYMNFIKIISNLRQIHYQSQETQQLQLQIEANNIQIIDKLASLEQLQAWKKVDGQTQPLLTKKLSVVKSPKQSKPQGDYKEDRIDERQERGGDLAQQLKQDENEENYGKINMFEELRNVIGEIGMYHEREESGVFQIFFNGQ